MAASVSLPPFLPPSLPSNLASFSSHFFFLSLSHFQVEEDNLLQRLQQTLDADPANPSSHYDLVSPTQLSFSILLSFLLALLIKSLSQGLILWRRGEESEGDEAKRLKEKAADSFLASAKLNPNNGDAFRSLGLFYEQVAGDRQRAAKCYQRAVTLNPDDAEAGVSVPYFLFYNYENLVPIY